MSKAIALTFSHNLYGSIDLSVSTLNKEFQSSRIVATKRIKPVTKERRKRRREKERGKERGKEREKERGGESEKEREKKEGEE